MNLYIYVGNNPVSFVDPYGLCKDEESRRRKYEMLQSYIKSAEAAMIMNIEALEVLHGEVEWLHDYYWGLLVGNTTVSAVSTVNTAQQFFQAASYAKSAEFITTKLPVHNTWDVSIGLYTKSASTLAIAKKSMIMDAAGTGISFISMFNISGARQKAVSKYDPLVRQTLLNIDTLSRDVSAARQEMRKLSYDK